jgi:hypothetical protein
MHAPVYLCLSTCTDGMLNGTAAPVGHTFPFVHKRTHLHTRSRPRHCTLGVAAGKRAVLRDIFHTKERGNNPS